MCGSLTPCAPNAPAATAMNPLTPAKASQAQADPNIFPPLKRRVGLPYRPRRSVSIGYNESASRSAMPILNARIAPGRLSTLARGVQASTYSPPTFGSLIATQWIEDETADALVQEVRTEIDARRRLAAQILGDALEMGAGAAPHVWAPMSELAAERLAGRCLREGVEVTPPSAPLIDPSLICGVRLCLGAPRDRATLERALTVVASALRNDAGGGERGAVDYKRPEGLLGGGRMSEPLASLIGIARKANIRLDKI
jgi:hypothetical protein